MRLKYRIDERGDLFYTHVNPKITVSISQSDDEGVIWCQNCYKEKPIFSVEFDGVDFVTLCKDCLMLLFDLHDQRVKP